MCHRSTFSAGGTVVDIRRRISEERYQTSYHVRKLKMAMAYCFYEHLVEISEEIAVYSYGIASNVKLEESRCF